MSKQTQQIPTSSPIELIEQARSGDQAAFECLLDRYAPLIDSMVHHFGADSSSEDREDLRQEAIVAFFRATKRYDTAQADVQFGLYAKLCIKNALASHFRKLKTQQNTVPLEEEGLWEEADRGSDPASRMMEEEQYLELSRLIHEALSEYENRIWWLYLAGQTAKEIAAELQKDEKSVQNAIYRIRQKLRTTIKRP